MCNCNYDLFKENALAMTDDSKWNQGCLFPSRIRRCIIVVFFPKLHGICLEIQIFFFYQPRTLNRLFRGSPMVSTCNCALLWASTSGVFCCAKILLYVFLLCVNCEPTYVATQLTAPTTTKVGSILKTGLDILHGKNGCT